VEENTMDRKKKFLGGTILLLILIIVLTACASISPAPGPTRTAYFTPTLGITPTSAAPTATPTPEIRGGLEIELIGFVRVIPDKFDPSTQPAEIVTEFDAEGGGIHGPKPLEWYAAPGYYQLQPDESNPAGNWLWRANIIEVKLDLGWWVVNEQVIVAPKYPLSLTVSTVEASLEDVNLITVGAGLGESLANHFPDLALQSGQFMLAPDEIRFSELSFGLQTNTVFDFHFVCSQPGLYHAQMEIPYSVSANGATDDFTLTYTFNLACPQNYTLWFVTRNSDYLSKVGSWIFQNGEYILQGAPTGQPEVATPPPQYHPP
jgi:hypothetical protein